MDSQKKRNIRDFFTPVPRTSLNTTQSSAPSPPQFKDSIAVRNPQVERPSTGSRAEAPDNPVPSKPAHFAANPGPSTTFATPTTSFKTARAGSADALPPPASQSSANSGSSKRVVSNGEQVVLNSDSDTDSLPDLDWGEPSNSFKMPTPSARAKPKSGRNDNALRKPPTQKETNGKHGKRAFSQLLQNAQKNADVERRIAESKADLDKPVEEPSQDYVISEEKLEEAIGDDEDPEKAKRLYLAMQRTNAMHMDYIFHFLGDNSRPNSVHSEFPIDSLPKHRWASIFEDASTRDQVFLTGVAQQIFRLQELPEEMASWMIDQICVGQNEALSIKYVELLQTHHQHFRSILDRSKLETLFTAAGADMQNLEPTQEVIASRVPYASSRKPPSPTVKPLARLLQSAAPWLPLEVSSHALYILFHVAMDHSVMADPSTLHGVQDAIAALLCNTDNSKLTAMLSEVLPLTLSRITHPILQKHVVTSLPTESPLTAYFQRHLALSFLLHPTPLDVPLADPKIPTLIHNLLRSSPGFQIQRDTDYSFLAARLLLLDIAIGPGPLSVPYQPLVDPVATTEGDSPPITAPFPLSSEEKEFNKEVDSLAQHIKLLGNLISETGAMVDLTRLDAKDRSERLYHRLEHAVRIGGKKFNNVFRGDDDDAEHEKKMWKRWLDKSGTATPLSGGGDD